MERKYQNGISVLVCTYNGAKRLQETLKYLFKQDFHLPWEIIVVNNASTDNTNEIVQNTSNSDNNIPLYLFNEPKSGKINALSLGFKKVKYKYVLICDDDNWLAFDYLSKAYVIMEGNPQIGILGGKSEGVFETSPPKWFDDISKIYAIGGQAEKVQFQIGSVYGAGSVIRKKAYDDLSKYNFTPILTGRKGNELSSGTDTELCLALQLLDYEIHYDEQLLFKHFMTSNRLNLSYFENLSKSMIYSNFILYAYHFSLKGYRPNYLNYTLFFIYLITVNTISFLYQNLKKQTPQKRLLNLNKFKIYYHFILYPKVFMQNWKIIYELRNQFIKSQN
jgi:glycosyltransferase involved in cell wall biosynthesis